MKKQILIVFSMLMMSLYATATDTFYLQGISGSAGTGTLTGDFFTTAPMNQTVDVNHAGVNYTKGIKFAGTASGMGSYPDRIVRYDCKSTKTEFTIVVYNKNSSAKDVKMGHILENAIGSANTVSSFDTHSAASKVMSVFTYTVDNPNVTPASFYVGVSSTDVYLVQVIAEEQGTLLPVPGSIGYKLNFNKARMVARSGNETWLDDTDIRFKSNENLEAGSTTKVKMQTKGTHFIQFKNNVNAAVKIGIDGIGKGFYVADDKDATINALEFPKEGGNKTYVAILPAGTHYIVPNGSNMYVTSLELTAAYTITFNANGGAGTMPNQLTGEGATQLNENLFVRPGYFDASDMVSDILNADNELIDDFFKQKLSVRR